MKLSIITPWYGETRDLLEDFAATVTGAEVIAVDNGTPTATRAALQAAAAEHGWFVVRNEHNAGFAAGNNQGYKAASGDIIVFLNSDVAPRGDLLAAVAHDVRDGALYGPSMAAQLVAGRWTPYLEGWCVAATRATWERIVTGPVPYYAPDGEQRPALCGPWDAEAYPGPYWEDNDLCLRAALAGVALIQTAWPVHHKGGRSAGPLTRWAASFEANRATFAARALAAFRGEAASSPAFARYYQELGTQSDIRHHLPLLHSLARGLVVELGTRTGVSTAALLAGVEARGGQVVSVDIDDCSALYRGHPQWAFLQGDSTLAATAAMVAELGPIDVLLIDTNHTYEHCAAELALWGPLVRPGGHILGHDPETFPGVRRAFEEYCAARGWPLRVVLPDNGMAWVEVPDA
jgi:predicted O-methyltransferase YrrM